MKKVLNMTYESSLTDLCSVNSSFDKGVIRIAYAGENRNRSYISKDTFERCIKSMYNCPIVCNYNREDDSIGAHDMELVKNKNGDLQLINMTVPVGVIPESAKYWWDVVTEDDDTEHEYLYTEALLWKRQEAYNKIKSDGIIAQSMEITVKDGESIDGVYHINDFEFTAFTLIGVEPCFESAAIEVFSHKEFKQQFNEMMKDFKESFNLADTLDKVDDTKNNYSTEGGNEELETNVNTTQEEVYELVHNLIDELIRELENVKISKDWGECPRYVYVDCDFESHEVYCYDSEDWLLYGFSFTVNGDSMSIDYNSKKRKKFTISDFVDGSVDGYSEVPTQISNIFNELESKLQQGLETKEDYQVALDTINAMESELNELRQFKANEEERLRIEKLNSVLERFEDLNGVESFEHLRESYTEYDAETLEEKCYAIRGRVNTKANFSLETKTPKLKVEKAKLQENEPYGGLFAKYGIEN